MWAEVQHHLLLTTTEDHRVGEGRHSGYDFDGTSASVVETSPCEEPSVRTPGPAGDRAVYNGGPDPDEDHHRNETTTFGNSSNNNGSGDGTELHLANILVGS